MESSSDPIRVWKYGHRAPWSYRPLWGHRHPHPRRDHCPEFSSSRRVGGRVRCILLSTADPDLAADALARHRRGMVACPGVLLARSGHGHPVLSARNGNPDDPYLYAGGEWPGGCGRRTRHASHSPHGGRARRGGGPPSSRKTAVSTLIDLEDIWLCYGGHPVLSGLTLSVPEREILALLGPSGCGKSSVLRLIIGLTPPDRGVVRLRGETVSENGRIIRLPEERDLAVVFQDLALWPHLTVRGNLNFVLGSKKVPREEKDTRITNALRRVGLTGMEHRYPTELSGGERQRVAIARALVPDPDAILLDEPASNLDVVLKRDLLRMFRQILKEREGTALYVTHDPREAASLGDRIAIMEKGRIVQVGELRQLRALPANNFVRALVEEI
ncbi:MAG: ABC transporter ATP-binding protein [Nitrospirae bacterium]|nr:MAG: ABC transporter ATP-binding protein [Nitrospirota bacterium]